MADVGAIVDDLRVQSQEVDDMVGSLSEEQWRSPTPAAGWTIAHQIAHLAWTDDKALIAATDPDAFTTEIEQAVDAGPQEYVDIGAEEGAAGDRTALLDHWRTVRERLAEALVRVPDGVKLPWYGPPMAAASMATARIMETWAHGQDVADALGLHRTHGPAMWHVARLGVRTRDFAYKVNGLAPPTEEFRIELTAPDGTGWTFGPEDARSRLTGAALDFCLLVTQRRNRADADLHAHGADVEEWLGIAQAFAGPPGRGRAPEVRR